MIRRRPSAIATDTPAPVGARRNRRSTRASVTGVVVVVVAALAVTTACGGTDTPSSTTPITRTTTSTTPTTVAVTDAGRAVGATFATTLGTALGVDLAMPDTESACAGSSLVAALGEDAARKVAAADPAKLTGSEKAAATAALDACVAGATLAGPVTVSFYKGLGNVAPTDAVTTCVAGQWDTKVGTVALRTVAANASGSMPKGLITTFDSCVLRDDTAAVLAGQFEASGVSAEAAKCIADKLKGTITIADLAEISGDNGNIPVDMQATIDDARLNCGAGG